MSLKLSTVVLASILATGATVTSPLADHSSTGDLAVAARSGLGFVNVEEVILQYGKTREITIRLEKKLQAEMESIRQSKRALQERLSGLEALDVNEENPASVLDRLRVEQKIMLDKVDLELREKSQAMQLEAELVEHMKKVYKEIQREVEIVARERNLSAVFMVGNRKVDGRTRAEVSSNILVRPVLWFDPALDLTSELVQRMNR